MGLPEALRLLLLLILLLGFLDLLLQISAWERLLLLLLLGAPLLSAFGRRKLARVKPLFLPGLRGLASVLKIRRSALLLLLLPLLLVVLSLVLLLLRALGTGLPLDLFLELLLELLLLLLYSLENLLRNSAALAFNLLF